MWARGHKSTQKRRRAFLKASSDIIRTQRGICSGLTRLIYSILQTPHKPHHNITQKLTPTLHHTVQKEKLKSCQISDFHFSQKKTVKFQGNSNLAVSPVSICIMHVYTFHARELGQAVFKVTVMLSHDRDDEGAKMAGSEQNA